MFRIVGKNFFGKIIREETAIDSQQARHVVKLVFDDLTDDWTEFSIEVEEESDGTEGQDRKSYSDNQDRENYQEEK